MAKDKKWVQKVTQSPKFKKDALTKTAQRHGAIKKSNGIKTSWLKQASKGKGVSKTTATRARFALKLKGFKKK